MWSQSQYLWTPCINDMRYATSLISQSDTVVIIYQEIVCVLSEQPLLHFHCFPCVVEVYLTNIMLDEKKTGNFKSYRLVSLFFFAKLSTNRVRLSFD